MSNFDESEIDRLAQLCRIEYTSEEKERLKTSLARIIDYFDELKNVNLEGILPCDHILENLLAPLREDEIGEILPREEFLAGAPASSAGLIKVPPMTKFEAP